MRTLIMTALTAFAFLVGSNTLLAQGERTEQRVRFENWNTANDWITIGVNPLFSGKYTWLLPVGPPQLDQAIVVTSITGQDITLGWGNMNVGAADLSALKREMEETKAKTAELLKEVEELKKLLLDVGGNAAPGPGNKEVTPVSPSRGE